MRFRDETKTRPRGDLSSRGDLSWQIAAFAVSCELRNFGVVSLFVSVGFLLARKSQLARANEPDASANQKQGEFQMVAVAALFSGIHLEALKSFFVPPRSSLTQVADAPVRNTKGF